MEQLPTVKKPGRSGNKFIALLAILSFLGVILIALAAGYFWMNFQQLSSTQTALQASLTQQQAQLTAAQQQLQTAQTSLQQILQQQQRRTQDWSLAEAEYLVRLANLNLAFSGNVPAAIALVTAADQELAQFSDPTLVPIRQALANDLSNLRAAPNVDLVGLLSRLNAVSQQISQLSLADKSLPKPNPEQAPVTAVTSNQSAWQKAMTSVSHAFKQMVVVHHVDQPSKALVSPEQQIFLIENIQLKLAQAEWAALQREPDIYQNSLKQVIDWVNQYFATNAATQSVQQSLADLAKVNIKPDLPKLDNSLQAIQGILQKPTKTTPAAPTPTPAPAAKQGSV